MTQTITNSYRVQILKATIGILRGLGPSVVKPTQRDEMVRVLEDLAERVGARKEGGVA